MGHRWDLAELWPAHDAQTARRAYDAETLQRIVDAARKYDPDGVLQVGNFTRMVHHPAKGR